jgi:hypothetical protein
MKPRKKSSSPKATTHKIPKKVSAPSPATRHESACGVTNCAKMDGLRQADERGNGKQKKKQANLPFARRRPELNASGFHSRKASNAKMPT